MLKRRVVVDRSGITAGQLQDFWRMAEDGTIDGRVLAHILENVGRIRKESLRGDFVTLIKARDIMGSNFFGLGDAEHFFNRKFHEEHEFFEHVPFTEDILRECQNDHMLVAVPRLSIIDMVEIFKEHGVSIYMMHGVTEPWFVKEEFARVQPFIGWHLIHKTGIDSEDGLSRKAVEIDPEAPYKEKIARATTLVYAALAYFVATRGQRLFGERHERTREYFIPVCSSDASSCKNCIGISFKPEHLEITGEFQDDCD